MDISRLKAVDPEIAECVQDEIQRQCSTLELIASENHVSRAVLQAMGSVLTDKYAEGYPHKRYYCGNENVDRIESICIERAKALFGAEHANVQPHSGTTANLAVYLAALAPGQKIMGMDLAHGGHLSHGMRLNASGRNYTCSSYGVREDTETLDMDQVRKTVLDAKPDMLVCGASAYPREIDFKGFAEIAHEAGALLLADIAHIAGLVVAGVHPSPLPEANFVTTTNHKTLRGPRGGIILCKQDWAKKINSAVFPGLQGGPLEHVIAAKAVAFAEAKRPEFADYARAIVANAQALAGELQQRDWRLVSGGTDNHMMLLDLRSRLPEVSGHVAADWLAAAGIVANKNMIPFDPRPPMQASGIRLGTPALTSRGMGPAEMTQVAELIDTVLTAAGDTDVIARVRGTVADVCRQFPIPADGDAASAAADA
ncbi:MAG: serine hydroxymethyltransferase [Phycisphaerae bacterium]|nr:serine hydroxymethyltransferase [Phycisphaerae bacterium]